MAGLCVVLVAIAVVAWKPWDRSTQTSSSLSPTAPANPGTPARNDSEFSNSSSTAAVTPPSQAPDQKPVASLPVVAADATLEIHLQRAEQESGYEVLGSKSLPLSKQDKVQLHVRLSGPSFAYVFWIDTDGACLRLWPETSELLDRERQQPVRELWLPPKSADNSPKQKMFFLDDSSGLETVLVATSPKPLSAAELRAIETARVDLAHFDAGRKELASFRSENWRKAQPDHTTLLLPSNSRRELVSLSPDLDRGIGGVIETVKNANRPIDDFSKRLNDVFGSYTAVVFSHE